MGEEISFIKPAIMDYCLKMLFFGLGTEKQALNCVHLKAGLLCHNGSSAARLYPRQQQQEFLNLATCGLEKMVIMTHKPFHT